MVNKVSEMPQKKRILVVDDEPGVLRFVKVGLNLAGYDVTTTTSGEEALKLISKNGFDVMLLDVFMEPVSGLDVLERLGIGRKLPVIVFSAGSSVIDRVMQAGADGFVAKPFKTELLAEKIEEVLARKKA
jgi:DNA-binding response OmpR family regulator